MYVAAEMQERQTWANLTQKNSVIFHDNDFEVFVDVDGSTHNYKEFEVGICATFCYILTFHHRVPRCSQGEHYTKPVLRNWSSSNAASTSMVDRYQYCRIMFATSVPHFNSLFMIFRVMGLDERW
jgi:hypothetical protein